LDLPLEDHRQTKEIIRMQMQRIALAIQLGSPLSEMHRMLQETKREIQKLKDPDLLKALENLQNEILGNWPIEMHTPWNHLEMIGRIFAFIDQKTVF
jgi:hypothetical protein